MPHRSLLACLLISSLLGAGGCASNQPEHRQEGAHAGRDVSADIEAVNNQIDTTLASLNSLLSADASKLQLAFDRYANEGERMQPRARRIADDAADLRTQSREYLSNWEKQHDRRQSAELRNGSEQQRLALVDRFQAVQSSYDRARTSLEQFMRDIEQVRAQLEADLTAHGISAVAESPIMHDTQRHGHDVKNSLHHVQDASAALAHALAAETAT